MENENESLSLHFKCMKREERRIYLGHKSTFFDALQLLKEEETFEKIHLREYTHVPLCFLYLGGSDTVDCYYRLPSFTFLENGKLCSIEKAYYYLSYFLYRWDKKVAYLTYAPPREARKPKAKEPPLLYAYTKEKDEVKPKQMYVLLCEHD